MNYYFSLCGINVQCVIPYEITIQNSATPFLTEECEPDFLFLFHPVSELNLPVIEGTWMVDACYYEHDSGCEVYHTPQRGYEPYCRVIWDNSQPNLVLCEYVAGQEDMIAYSGNLMNLLGFEMFLLKWHGFLLHSSFIRTQGHAVLFTAPPETGKSTQADLWVKYENAEVLNGDRAALRKCDGVWTAWGSPFAGSSGIYRNASAPVKAIVVLRQANENCIRRLSVSEAIRYVYPEVSIHRWDPEFVNTALNLLTDLLMQVPVFMLECLPDQGAVQVLKDTLFTRRDHV